MHGNTWGQLGLGATQVRVLLRQYQVLSGMQGQAGHLTRDTHGAYMEARQSMGLGRDSGEGGRAIISG
jgi:hypothetical protein